MRVSENVRPTVIVKTVLISSIPPWYPGDYSARLFPGLPRCGVPGMSLDGPSWDDRTDWQLPGSMASERATGLTSHLEAMGCRKSARVM